MEKADEEEEEDGQTAVYYIGLTPPTVTSSSILHDQSNIDNWLPLDRRRLSIYQRDAMRRDATRRDDLSFSFFCFFSFLFPSQSRAFLFELNAPSRSSGSDY